VYGLLADLIVAVHVAYVSFVILGLLLTLVGGWRGWCWVRNPWFRLLHLFAIVIVAAEAVYGVDCPLTVWEHDLRVAAGQEATGESFVGRLLHGMIFYDLPPAVFTAFYVAFAALVAGSLWLVPLRWKSR
jgi:hypothetical protein